MSIFVRPELLLENARREYRVGRSHVESAKTAAAPTKSYSLSGELYLSKSGWLLLRVSNNFVRGLFDSLDDPGLELPLKDGRLNGHCSVMSPDEIEKIGGPDVISERGHHYRYSLGPIKTVKPSGWDDVSLVYYVTVDSPELRELRRSYGLEPLRKGFDHHITIALRKSGVLHTNEKSKAASDKKAAGINPAVMGLLDDAIMMYMARRNAAQRQQSQAPSPVSKPLPLPMPAAKPATVEPPIKEASGPTYEEESEQIRQRKAVQGRLPHKFRAAEWTHKNGHPRCCYCGDEETMDGQCAGAKEAAVVDKSLPAVFGHEVGTKHKRVAISKKILNENDLLGKGFRPSLIAIPEEGQDRWTSFRHPETNLHAHSHPDYWTMHRDRHPAMAAALASAAGPGDWLPAAWKGVKHVATEGVPGGAIYAQGQLRKALGWSNGSGMVDRLRQESPGSVIDPGFRLRWGWPPVLHAPNRHKEAESLPALVAAASKQVDRSPSDAQLEAGNYAKGHVRVQGLDISIENPKGGVRSGTSKDGKAWSVTMKNPYGYIKRVASAAIQKGKDGDHVDVFLGDALRSEKVFIVNQNDPATGKFDEVKCVVGCRTATEAKKLYMDNYSTGWTGFRSIASMSMAQFKEWLKKGDMKKPAESAPVVEKAVVQHHTPAVEIPHRHRSNKQVLCPHCGEELTASGLYTDAKKWVFCRKCLLKGKGSIKLPAGFKSAADGQSSSPVRDAAALAVGSVAAPSLLEHGLAGSLGAKKFWHGTSDAAAKKILQEGMLPTLGGALHGIAAAHGGDVPLGNAPGHVYVATGPLGRPVAGQYAAFAERHSKGLPVWNKGMQAMFEPVSQDALVAAGKRMLSPFGGGSVLQGHMPMEQFREHFSVDPEFLETPGMRRTGWRSKSPVSPATFSRGPLGGMRSAVRNRSTNWLQYAKKHPLRLGGGAAFLAAAPAAIGLPAYGLYRHLTGDRGSTHA